MKLRVFETFSGIGAQHRALDNLKSKGLIDYEIVGTSDWDIYATASYAAIHHSKDKVKSNKEQIDKFFKEQTLSINGKKESDMGRFSPEARKYIYESFVKSNNIGSIVDSYERVRDNIGFENIDLLTYSFPCQDLSTAGNFHGFNEGITKNTRSGLLLEIEKLLKKIKATKKHQVKKQRERERERERERRFFPSTFYLKTFLT